MRAVICTYWTVNSTLVSLFSTYNKDDKNLQRGPFISGNFGVKYDSSHIFKWLKKGYRLICTHYWQIYIGKVSSKSLLIFFFLIFKQITTLPDERMDWRLVHSKLNSKKQIEDWVASIFLTVLQILQRIQKSKV